MTINCPTCNTELPNSHPAGAVDAFLTWVEANGGWTTAFEDRAVGWTLNFNTIPVEVVGLKTTYETGDVDVDGYYGESSLPQGSTFDAYVVVKIGDFFYRMTGLGDSYGDVNWNGTFRRVEAIQRTVWEFK
jgi:hypothetical protein